MNVAGSLEVIVGAALLALGVVRLVRARETFGKAATKNHGKRPGLQDVRGRSLGLSRFYGIATVVVGTLFLADGIFRTLGADNPSRTSSPGQITHTSNLTRTTAVVFLAVVGILGLVSGASLYRRASELENEYGPSRYPPRLSGAVFICIGILAIAACAYAIWRA
jgi:hypothetical protein